MRAKPWSEINDRAIREFAYDAVVSMGDIFFDPDRTAGENHLPGNIAQNKVAAHIRYLLKAMNIKVNDVLADLPEVEKQ